MTGHTVLVLGAGASFAYGLPLGNGLVAKIRDLLPSPNAARLFEKTQVLHDQLESMPEVCAWIGRTGRDLRSALTEFRELLIQSDPKSIDQFLSRDFGDTRQVFQQIGKISIAHLIAEHESESFFNNLDTVPNDWYRYLWQDCLYKDSPTLDKLKSKTLKIVNFNYDRSLEYFLGRRIAANYFPQTGQVLDQKRVHAWAAPGFQFIADHFHITHPYGTLGGLIDVPYGSKDNAKLHGIEMAKRICVIGEDRPIDSFAQAREWIDHANRIVFLGFGFDTTNMGRLGLENGLRSKLQTPGVFGSKELFPLTYGFEMGERNQLRARYFSEFFVNRYTLAEGDEFAMSSIHSTMNICQYLRKTGALFEV